MNGLGQRHLQWNLVITIGLSQHKIQCKNEMYRYNDIFQLRPPLQCHQWSICTFETYHYFELRNYEISLYLPLFVQWLCYLCITNFSPNYHQIINIYSTVLYLFKLKTIQSSKCMWETCKWMNEREREKYLYTFIRIRPYLKFSSLSEREEICMHEYSPAKYMWVRLS